MLSKNVKRKINLLFIYTAFVMFGVAQDFAEADDFDSLFEDAAEDIIVKEVSNSDIKQTAIQSPNSMINFSGRLDADVGVAMLYNEKWSPSGYLDFDNVFNMKVRPDNRMALNASVKTNNENQFTMYLSDMYIDYLIFDRVYVSSGLKSSETLGGYTRILEDSSIDDTSDWINIDVRYPWSTGLIKVLGAYNQKNRNVQPSSKDITYGGQFEQTIGHTNVNIFAKKYGEDVLENNIHKHPVVGLELKRTILGFDIYSQSSATVVDYKKISSKDGYERLSVIAGFYRLWDSCDPNFGFNIEYKYQWNSNIASETVQTHQIAYEAGLKRMGRNKNLKLGLEGNHYFNTQSGNTKLAFLIGDVFSYANWVNAVSLTYQKDMKAQVALASIISIDLDY